jgi:hypothetical protein
MFEQPNGASQVTCLVGQEQRAMSGRGATRVWLRGSDEGMCVVVSVCLLWEGDGRGFVVEERGEVVVVGGGRGCCRGRVKCEAGYDVCVWARLGHGWAAVIKRRGLARLEAPVFRKYREGAAL